VNARRRIATLVVLLLAAAPDLAHACAACIDLKSKNRVAFFSTTIVLSLLPLGMVGGMAVWLRRRARALAPEVRDTTP
jgi:hypothetical protein